MTNNTILIVAPHADDETLGCGGTILRFVEQGYQVHWLLITGMSKDAGFIDAQIEKRKVEIDNVANEYQFSGVHQLNFPPAQLETLPKGELIGAVCNVIGLVKPEQVFTVYRNDAHSDHEIVFDVVASATKTFRYPFVKKIYAYETLSETDFGLKPEDGGFRPNVFIDIEQYLDKKLDILEMFESEVGDFPFPRSRKALDALASVRGVQAGTKAAEAFMLLKEVI